MNETPQAAFNVNCATAPDKQQVVLTIHALNSVYQVALPKEMGPSLLKVMKEAFDGCTSLVLASPFGPNGNRVQ